MVYVPNARLAVVNVATPLDSVSLPSVPFWSLKVTVPPLGVAPPAVKSLTVAVKVTDWPGPAAAVEAISAVSVGSALDRVRCSRKPTRGRNPARGCDSRPAPRSPSPPAGCRVRRRGDKLARRGDVRRSRRAGAGWFGQAWNGIRQRVGRSTRARRGHGDRFQWERVS